MKADVGHDALRARAAATYDAAADHYDSPENCFWERFGVATVERMKLAPGASVLDVCCGSGASAIPAAEAVGLSGRVVAVDVSERLLGLLREKASARGLRNLEATAGDLLDLGLLGRQFDAVVCVFGIFFVAPVIVAPWNS